MRRIPIRLRLTLPFAIATALVLAATAVFVHVRVGASLLSSIDANLHDRLDEAVGNAQAGRTLIDEDGASGPSVAAVERPSGGLLSATPDTLAGIPIEGGGGVRLYTAELPRLHGRWRVIAAPQTIGGRRAVVLVAESLEGRDETLEHLEHELLVAAPVAALLAVLAGYALAAGALRPVEAMRRRAAAVTPSAPGRRLPVPQARDELQALALTLNDMLARVDEAFEHERRFLADASHELRTPLALLRTELELALRQPRSREELEDAVRSAAEETERLTRLAEDLLFVARADQGALPIRRDRVEVAEVLGRVRDRFATRAETAGRALRVEGAPAAVVVADRDRLEQAVGNLVDNALVHGRGTVTLREEVRNGSVELHVSDEGPGISREYAVRAFERFSRADEARARGGTGLGLSIVALIAGAHGGTARIEPRGGGSDAWVSVPRE
jgi:heavy metal sensor kinase